MRQSAAIHTTIKMNAAIELKRIQSKAKRESLENKFLFIWRAINGPELLREHRPISALIGLILHSLN